MSNIHAILKPATLAAFLFFAGGLSAAHTDQRLSADAPGESSQNIRESSRKHARQATEAAAEDAAQAVAAETRLELDMKQIGRSSVLIAGDV